MAEKILHQQNMETFLKLYDSLNSNYNYKNV